MATSAPRKPVVKTPAKPAAKKAVNSSTKAHAVPSTAAAKKAPSAVKPALVKAATTKPVAKSVKPSVARPVAKPKARSVEKVKKAKLVRDSFTMPETEYAALSEVKKACLKAGFEVKKSELLRIGVALVRKLALAVVKQELGALAPLKPGRPRKEKTTPQ